MVTLDDCFRRSVLAFKSVGHWLRKMPRKGSDSKPVVTAPRWEEVQGKSRECLWWSANNISTIGLYCFTVAFIITGFTDFCNPDKLLLCPYDPHHLIRACRFPYHLIKCRKVRVQRPPQHKSILLLHLFIPTLFCYELLSVLNQQTFNVATRLLAIIFKFLK